MGSIPGSGQSPGEESATYSDILTWEIPWREEPDGAQSMESKGTGQTYRLNNNNYHNFTVKETKDHNYFVKSYK